MQKSVRRLSTQFLGLVGFGAIGRAVAERAPSLGLQLGYYDLHLPAWALARLLPI